MNPSRPARDDILGALRDRLDARAAGWWRRVGERLEGVAFVRAADLPESVARDFSGATRSVPLTQTDLGIVRAAVTGRPTVSRAEDGRPDSGSSLWLRRFGAERSVAVPVPDDSGAVVGVVSVALSDSKGDDEAIAAAVAAAARGWSDVEPSDPGRIAPAPGQ